MSEDYSDIIDMEHVTVEGHPRMSMAQRATQFAPFAALSTHGFATKNKAPKANTTPADTTTDDYTDPDWDENNDVVEF